MTVRPAIVVTRRLPASVEQKIRDRFDARLNTSDAPLSTEQLKDAVRSADALLCTVTDRLDADILSVEAIRVRVLGNFGAGYDHIDLVAARQRNIVVTNTPDVLTEDTADLAIALMLMSARRAGEGERNVRSGAWMGWRPTQMLGTRFSGKTLGIIGLGRIGRAVARRAHHGFGMRILFYDRQPPSPTEAKALGAERCTTIEEVLEWSDFVSVHTPAGPETRHLLNADRLRHMKPSAFLINTARGDIVDENALIRALQSRAIAGAGLDVYEREPVIPPELLAMENVVLLPHVGSATHEGRVAMGERVLDNLVAFFDGRSPRDRVA